MKKIQMLGCPMHILTMDQTLEVIDNSIMEDNFIQHGVINVAKLVNMRLDSQLDCSVKACDIINIDGMGVVFGARFLGFDVKERVAGVDLFFRLLELSSNKNYSVYLLGAEEQVVSRASQKIKILYPKLHLVGSHHGYFWDDEKVVVDKINQSGAQLLFIAITSPRKENFINKWKDQLGVSFVMGVGGTFDVVAGKVKRAPIWMQKSGMEWFYRILQEPRRMWKRYLITNSKYIWLLIKEKMK